MRIVNSDAFTWLKENREIFDFIVVDFPDPSNFSIGKLYTTAFYQRARSALAQDGAIVIQCTSPFVARKSFWCIDETLRACGFVTEPYHTQRAVLRRMGLHPRVAARARGRRGGCLSGLRFLDAENFAALSHFPPDMARVAVEVNRLNNQALVRYFEDEWARYSAAMKTNAAAVPRDGGRGRGRAARRL